jgi:hypothetical protein
LRKVNFIFKKSKIKNRPSIIQNGAVLEQEHLKNVTSIRLEIPEVSGPY